MGLSHKHPNYGLSQCADPLKLRRLTHPPTTAMPEPTTYGFPRTSFDPSTLPDFDTEFIDKADIDEFAKALNAPETSPVVALNDWRPVSSILFLL